MTLDDKTKAVINNQAQARGLVTSEVDEDSEIHVDRLLKIKVSGAVAEVTLFDHNMDVEDISTIDLADLAQYISSKIVASPLTC